MALAGGKSPARNRKGKSEETLVILMAMIPCIGFYVLFMGFPIVYALYLSFHRWSVIDEPVFVGINNYQRILTDDPVFFQSLQNTVIYALAAVLIGIVLALSTALLINSLKRFVGLFRTVYFLPVVTSMVAAAVVWRWLYQSQFGFFNQVLSALGLSRIPWLDSPRYALMSVIIMMLWKGLGFNTVLFMAGLHGIPSTYKEAAVIDGANSLQILIHLTLPLLKPTLVFVLITGFIHTFQAFTEMYILTQGGPLRSTTTIVMYLYERAFDWFQMGYASAVAFILFIVIIALTLFQLRFSKTGWEY